MHKEEYQVLVAIGLSSNPYAGWRPGQLAIAGEKLAKELKTAAASGGHFAPPHADLVRLAIMTGRYSQASAATSRDDYAPIRAYLGLQDIIRAHYDAYALDEEERQAFFSDFIRSYLGVGERDYDTLLHKPGGLLVLTIGGWDGSGTDYMAFWNDEGKKDSAAFKKLMERNGIEYPVAGKKPGRHIGYTKFEWPDPFP